MATQEDQFDYDPVLVRDDDGESSAGAESVRDSTTSITSSLLDYRTLHGRTYQGSQTTEYWAPNDSKHIEAFDVAHQWLTMMQHDKLFLAPITDSPQRILDLGTGTGIWAIDVAEKFPSAQVVGTDISPTQPSWIPPNLSFEIDDAQLDWTYQPESFDFIHIRYMHAAIADWPRLYEQIYKFLKPGGWFQHTEPNIELRCENPDVGFERDDHVYKQWAKLFYDAGDKIGRTFRFDGETMVGWATGAGFSQITHRKFKVPHSPWARDHRLKEMGAYVGLYMDLSLDGFALYPIGQILGWTLEEVQALVENMRGAIKDPRNRTVSDMHMVYGQKPLAASGGE